MRALIALWKLFLFALICFCATLTQPLILLFHKGKYAYIIPRLLQKATCMVMNISVITIGIPSKNRQTMYVCNHISYLDIPAIGSIISGSFIAKKDVASWPVFGFLARLQQTLFISRNREDAATEKAALNKMLDEGKNFILFPEGTSSEGTQVLPFKSSLFSIAFQDNAKNLMIQPITLTLTKINGQTPENQNERDIYAWHINMDTPLLPHLWRFAQTRGTSITLTFHPPIKANECSDRKTLAKHCHNAVSNGLGKET